jgi:SM-20-related protein
MMPESTLHAHVASRLRADGWCVVEHAFAAAEVRALADECRDFARRAQLAAAAVGRESARTVASAVRGDRTRWFEPQALSPAQAAYWTRIDALRIALNRELLLGLDAFEAHYALYPPGAGYARHRDRFRDDDARVLSSVLYLNENWDDSDGGALRFHLAAPSPPLDVLPRAGTLVLFLSADFEHEVLPARRERLSIAGWFRRLALPLR